MRAAALLNYTIALLAGLALFPCEGRAQAASRTQTPSPEIAAAQKAKPKKTPPPVQAKSPVTGQPFDDREVEAHVKEQGLKLFAANRIKKLSIERRTCSLQLTEPDNVKLPWPAVDARSEAATVVIGEFYRQGTSKPVEFSIAAGGFLVTDTGACVTSLHVINEKTSRGFCAMLRDGRVFPIKEALAVDPVNDLAIMQLDLPPDVRLPILPLASAPAPVGSSIVVMSHPDNRFYMLTNGIVARHTIWRDIAGDQAFMTITADFAKGSSGCPVLDEHGAVVGIVNNTESIYYSEDGPKKQVDLQMVVKNTTPSWIVRRMVTPP